MNSVIQEEYFCGFAVKENACKLITYLAWLLLALKSEKKDENGGTFQKDSFNSHKKSRILPSSFSQTNRKIHAKQPKKVQNSRKCKVVYSVKEQRRVLQEHRKKR